MLKKRIIATLLVKNRIVVQSVGFNRYMPIGKLPIALEYLNNWGIDEIIILDISASKEKKEPDYEMISEATLKCFVPVTVGGGINSLSHIRKLMSAGADKVSLNYSAIYNPLLIKSASEVFGNQSVVGSIDAIKTGSGYSVFDYLNKRNLSISPSEFAIKLQESGAGEILINSVDRDGSYLGFDNELVDSICNEVKVPVIALGGAKNGLDIADVLQRTRASAASAGNFFHFYEHSVNITKSILAKQMDIRLETLANYTESEFDDDLRLIKKADSTLEKLLFVRIEKEVI